MKSIITLVLFTIISVSGFCEMDDSIYTKPTLTGTYDTTPEVEMVAVDATYPDTNSIETKKEKSLQQQAEEIPVVFGQWWFWVGLFAVILFLKFVIFKK